MAMGIMIQAASVLAGINVVMLLALTGVWVRNYRSFGTTLLLGLISFGVAMLAENVLALYFFFSMASLYSGDQHVQQAVLILRGVELVALGFLTYVTMQ